MKTLIALSLVVLCVACAPEPKPETTPRRVAATDEGEPPPPTAQPPRKRTTPAPTATPKRATSGGQVDCHRMCSRTFIQCVGEVLVATKKMDPAKIALLKKAGAWSKVQQAGYQACSKDCAKKAGFGTDAAGINQCLALTGCTPYANCMKQYVK